MELYTFILGFRGGTYISQVYGKEVDEAITLWAKELKIDEIKHFGFKSKEELIIGLGDEEPGLINDTINVWISCVPLKKGFAIIHIIKTDDK